ncbi:lycopene cyclase domain-containing protein [Kocuria flava]|uniref:lycopene cyclase domain-containing protein n=1 Tax=Kocuria flava TaxID=446860 RepID=UPI0027E34202|nr:lycopene cyclase domain-containing protein [Kocuria flava]
MSALLPFAYLGFLLLSLAGMVVLDVRQRLFFAADPRRAGLVLLAGLVFFLAWDAAGILLGIFLHSESRYATGWMVAPQVPVEEVVFLAFLCYLIMNTVRLVEQALARRTAAPAREDAREGSRP